MTKGPALRRTLLYLTFRLVQYTMIAAGAVIGWLHVTNATNVNLVVSCLNWTCLGWAIWKVSDAAVVLQLAQPWSMTVMVMLKCLAVVAAILAAFLGAGLAILLWNPFADLLSWVGWACFIGVGRLGTRALEIYGQNAMATATRLQGPRGPR